MHFIYLFAFVCSVIRSIDRHTHRHSQREQKVCAAFLSFSYFVQTPAHTCVVVGAWVCGFFSWFFIFKHSDGTWIQIELPRCRSYCRMFWVLRHPKHIKNQINWRNEREKEKEIPHTHTQSSFEYTHIVWRISWCCLVLLCFCLWESDKKRRGTKTTISQNNEP